MTGVNLVVRAVDLRVRHVGLRLPFRFGASTLTACPQLFVRVDVDIAGHGSAQGFAAELMVPKWFDKRAGLTPDDNIAQLGSAARQAAAAYLNDKPASSFGLFARHCTALMAQGAAAGFTELTTGFGQAIVDKAIVDALCRALGISFFEAAQRNAFGFEETPLVPDLPGWNWPTWLASLRPVRRIEARHTIGLVDELDSVRYGEDGLPISLRAVIERYGHRSFKIKIGVDPASDLERLRDVLGLLDATVGDYRYTIDGNEQYASLDALSELLVGLATMKPPLYIEQPVPRELSLATALPANPIAPLLMDEADGTLDAFARGRALGWTGVSSKACKGLYKSLINRARCECWNLEAGDTVRHVMSAEDLTCQAGLAVQQDLALVALLGITDSERNGHHYGAGFGDAPAAEQHAFAEAHPDLYELHDGAARLRIERGVIAIDSLFAPGYAHAASPDWQATQAL
ncbi:MAG: enolase C-terminal domain-like protein [Burkholderiales bacterium]